MLACRSAYAQNDEDLLGGFDKPAQQPATKPADDKPAAKPANKPAATPPPATTTPTPTPPSQPTTETKGEPAVAPAEPTRPAPPPDKPVATDNGQLANPASLDRIKAVPRKPLLKVHRFELTPMASLSLNDAYYQHYALGGTAIYYPHDAFGIGVGVDYLYESTKRNAVDEVRASLTSVPAVFDTPKLFAHLDMYWVPLYGKFSLFNAAIIPFDVYASAGGGAATAFSAGRWMPEVNAALGTRMGMTEWLALRIEVRDHWFLDTQEVNGLKRSDVQNYLMAQIGLSFFIPPTFEYSF